MSSGAVDPRRLADRYKPAFGIPWTPRLTREQLEKMSEGPGGVQKLLDYQKARAEAEAWAKRNKTGSGWTLPSWQRIMDAWPKYKTIIILGGNRSAKTEFASRLCVWALGTIPECEIRAYDVNEQYSKQRQQAYIEDALPAPLKSLPTKRGPNHAISFRQGQGFTNNQLILPPLPGWQKGGTINFVNYNQYLNDPQTSEGWRAHIVWADEEIPAGLFETLPYRLADYHGRLIVTFTVLNGWTDTVNRILGKVRTLEWRYSELVKRKLPVMQESLTHADTVIFYLWTTDNPFVPTDYLLKNIEGQPEEVILARAHGIPTKSATAAFPMFSRDYAPHGNVVRHEDLPFIKNPQYACTHYMAVDPAGSKNWTIGYVAIDAAGTWWIWQEWPDQATYGDWAVPSSTVEGKAGPAQRSLGYGIRDYAEEMRRIEKEANVSIFERIIDPRMGNAEKQSADEGATTIISDLDKHDVTFIPAPGVDIDNGLQILQGLMRWNPNKERDAINSPKFFISDRCQNIIHCFSEYTAKGGPNEATKDFVDPFRYLAVSNAMYVAPEDASSRGNVGSY